MPSGMFIGSMGLTLTTPNLEVFYLYFSFLLFMQDFHQEEVAEEALEVEGVVVVEDLVVAEDLVAVVVAVVAAEDLVAVVVVAVVSYFIPSSISMYVGISE